MRRNLFLMLAMVVLSVAAPSKAEIESNRRLGDVMLMLVDQVGGIGELSKMDPPSVDDKAFYRVTARARGGAYLLELVAEKMGHVQDGKLVADDLTPGKLLTVEGDELVTMIGQFNAALDGVKTHFMDIEKELSVQSTTIPAERNFRSLKLLMVKLDQAIKSAHQAFKP